MRLFSSVLIWIVFIGGLSLYISSRDTRNPAKSQIQEEQAVSEKHHSITITSSFTTEADPFALITEDNSNASFNILLDGIPLKTEAKHLTAGRPLVIENIPGVTVGENEFFMEASPPMSHSDKVHALRIQVFEEDRIISEKTIWTQPGGKAAGTLKVTIEDAQDHEEEHEHP